MNKIITNRLRMAGSMALAALALLVSSCDDVKESDRLIDYPLPPASKTLLIMEFTGQNCSNCPSGAAQIHSLQEAYPDGVIAVCLHPEGVEFTNIIGKVDLGLRSKTATEIYRNYPTNSFPYAIFDGVATEESKSYLQWVQASTPFLQAETPVKLEVEATYDKDRNISVHCKADFVRGEYQRPLNIAVWIMENGIVGPQMSSSGRLKDYTHNHVLRTSLNGAWGESFGTSFSLDDEKEYATSLQKADATWKLENCQIVAFLVDPDSKHVLQSAITDLAEQQD